jgi:hypothetical protein
MFLNKGASFIKLFLGGIMSHPLIEENPDLLSALEILDSWIDTHWLYVADSCFEYKTVKHS